MPISCVAGLFFSRKTFLSANGVDEKVNQVARKHLITHQFTTLPLKLSTYTGYIPPSCCCNLPESACDVFPFLKNSEEKKRELELANARKYFLDVAPIYSLKKSYKQKLIKILEELIRNGCVDNEILKIVLINSDYKEFIFPIFENMLKNHVVNQETAMLITFHRQASGNDEIISDALARMQLTILTTLNQSELPEEELLDLICYHVKPSSKNPKLQHDLTLGLKNLTRDIITRILAKNLANDKIIFMLYHIKEYVRKEDFQNLVSNMLQRNAVTVQTLQLDCLPHQMTCDIVDNILKNKLLIQEHPKILKILFYSLSDHYISRIIDSAIINKTVDNNILKTAIKNKFPRDLIERIVKDLIQLGKADETTLKILSSTSYQISQNVITHLINNYKKVNDYILLEAINSKMNTDLLIAIIKRMIKDRDITSNTFEISVRENLPAEVIKHLLNQIIEKGELERYQAKSLNILVNALKSNVISSEKISFIVDEMIKWEFGENTILGCLLYYGHHNEIDRVVEKMQNNHRMDPLSHIIHEISKKTRPS